MLSCRDFSRVLIAGVDGCLGGPLAQTLAARGHEIAGIDFHLRGQHVGRDVFGQRLPIEATVVQFALFRGELLPDLGFHEGDLKDCDFVRSITRDFKPEFVGNIGECLFVPFQ